METVKSGGMTICRASDIFDVSYTSLQRRVTCSQGVIKRCGGQSIMDEVAEKKFAERLIYLATRGFGITPKNVRKYAFDFVTRQNLQHNFNTNTKMTGED